MEQTAFDALLSAARMALDGCVDLIATAEGRALEEAIALAEKEMASTKCPLLITGDTPWKVCSLRPSKRFHSIEEHACVTNADGSMVIAVCGPAGDTKSMIDAIHIAAMPKLFEACREVAKGPAPHSDDPAFPGWQKCQATLKRLGRHL